MLQDDEADRVELRSNHGVQTNIFFSSSSLRSISESDSFDHNAGAGIVQVNESLFIMDEENREVNEEIQEFEVHAERVDRDNYFVMGNDLDDEYCSTPPVSENESDENPPTLSEDAPLKIKRIQKVSCGYVINSNVYLSENQWHTLILDEGINQIYCVLCDEYLDTDTAIVHLEDEAHEANIQSHEPIKRFELSITRKIRNKYHCAVCNEIFDDSEDEKHVDNKKHGDNMLFAINKASDIVYDYNLENSYEATADIATNYVPRDVNYNPVQMSVDNNEKPPNDDDYNNNPSNDYENDIFYDDDIEPQVFGVSYAAMASKAVEKPLPTNYRIDLGDKVVTVKYDSWHMIMYCKANELYCMACLVFDHKRNKGEHCKSISHLQKLKKCEVINAYETHLIRRVDDRLYHCGHCNNLQPISEMENHVEQVHPNTNKISNRNGIKVEGTPIPNGQPTKINDNNVFEIEEETVIEQDVCTDNELFSYTIPNTISIANDYDNNVNDKQKTDQEIVNMEKTTNDEHNLQNVLIDNHTIATNAFVDKNFTNCDGKVVAHGANLLYKRNTKFLKEHAKQYFNNNNLQEKAQDNLITTENDNQQQKKSYSNVTATPVKKTNKKNVKTEQKSNPFIYTPKTEEINIPQVYANITGTDIHIGTQITIIQFGHKLTLSVLSYNTILRPCILYCCVTCDLMVDEKFLLQHIWDTDHLRWLKSVPYDAKFSFNLIRKIKKYLHCGICNMILPSDKTFVLNHNVSPEHAVLLRKALGFQTESPNNSTIVPKTNNKAPNINDKEPKHYDKVPKNNDKISNHNNMVLNSKKVSYNNQNVPSRYDQVSNNNAKKETKVINCDKIIHSEENESLEVKNFKSEEDEVLEDKNIDSEENEGLEDKNIDSEENEGVEDKNIDSEEKDKIIESDEDEVLEDNIDSEEDEAVEDLSDVEEYILAKLKNVFVKLDTFSWHTLVECGDGTNYCFLCAIHIDCDNNILHIKTKKHLYNIEECKVLSNYGTNMIRQIENQYHCGTCNVIIDGQYLKQHLEWSKHLWNTQSSNSDNKNALEMSGIEEIDLILQKEKTRAVKDNSKFNVILDVIIDKSIKKDSNDVIVSDEKSEEEKGDIVVTINEKTFSIGFENWHGLVAFRNGFTCRLCGVNIGRDDATRHVQKSKHLQHSKKPFLEEYPEAFIRELSDMKLHCVLCNLELSIFEDINQHIRGNKHKKNRKQVQLNQ